MKYIFEVKGDILVLNSYLKTPIQRTPTSSKLVLKGVTGTGKSTALLERYRYMVDDMKLPSENILILLINRMQSLYWREKTILDGSSNIWRTSYYGFIQEELKKYYPLILKKCEQISHKRIKPIFLTFEASQFLMSKVIDWRRKNNGMFSDITSYSDKIAVDLASNLVKCAFSDIPFSQMGKRLYNSLEVKDDKKRQIFYESDEITKSYKDRCMELGIFDFAMAIEIYNKYLLSDNVYKEHLFGRVKHLIIDNVEECVPSCIDLIKLLIPKVDSCYIGYNYHGGYGKSFGSNHDYVVDNLLNMKDLEVIELKDCYTCDPYMYEFSDMLFDNIYKQTNNIFKKDVLIERTPATDLRSNMLENVALRVIKLIEEDGYKPSDIVILSTYADTVTEFVISRTLESRGLFLKNLARSNRIIDNQFSKALITLASLCHPKYGVLPNKDDIRILISMILKIDPIRSSVLAEEICKQKPFAEFPDLECSRIIERIGYYNVEKYKYIKTWVSDYKKRNSSTPINDFFQEVFLEVLLSEEATEHDILCTKNLIDSAKTFVEIVSKFNRDASKDYLNMVRKGIKSAESIFEVEEKLKGDYVLMSTPIAYLASDLKNKVIILTSISSDNWAPRSAKEMTNVHVLTKTWNENDVYTNDIEEKNQKTYLAIVMRAILKKCKNKIITFESNISSNGYENDGILSEYFNEIFCQS